jgi:hypothetical protein
MLMALYSKKNPYPGINIHLNSFLQEYPDEWISYHSDHLTNLREYLDRNLPDGYYAKSETSLQIGGFNAGTGEEHLEKIRPDVNIFRNPNPNDVPSENNTISQSLPIGSLTILDTVDLDEDDPLGLVIYSTSEHARHDQPVVRIELLSPSNKIGGSYYKTYTSKRLKALETGLVLVEIDYLHASRPVIHNLPSYADKHKYAYPYIVLVSDPRPTLSDGKTDIYAWHVDDEFPVIPIPLVTPDSISVELGKVYDYTYETTRYFHRHLDFATEPLNFDSYTDEDKEKISEMLTKIRAELED